jgi:outer membrane receptor protein involved in Fe transport
MKKYLLFFSLILGSQFIMAQKVLNGKVVDAKNLPIIGALINCDNQTAISDIDGNFSLETSDDCILKISAIGYSSQEISMNKVNNGFVFTLSEFSENLETLIISASKFEQRLSETTVSVDVLKPDLVKSVNAIKTEDVLNKIPGVQMINGQANIRGGSGFSYGAGSRVMALYDDIPFLQVDAGVANWGDIPIEAIGQIEVVKGASSALFGSSALNGIVHFRSQKPSNTPETNFFTSYTQYQQFDEPKYKWWDDTYQPSRFNLGISHSRKINKLDLLSSAFYTNTQSYNKDTYDKAGRFTINLKYNLYERVKFGVNTLVNLIEKSDFFIWRNALRGILQPFDGTISFGKRKRVTLDPFLHYFTKNGWTHKFNSRFFYVNNDNNANQQVKSYNFYTEYAISNFFQNQNLHLSAGLVNNINDSEAELFGNNKFLYQNSAVYVQADKKLFNKLNLSGGLRYEYNKQNSPDSIGGIIIPNGEVVDDKVIARLGANYQLKDFTSFRASWGQGYRYPTITERFINTSFGGFNIFPNPLLKPEFGWSAEFAIKQGFKLNAFKGFVDLAVFTSEYKDMIEFTFLERTLGFQPINIGDTKINGFEASINGQVQIWKVPITILTGYTYIDPQYKNFETNKDLLDNISTTQNVLKYRSKHQAKLDVEANYKFLSIGFSSQYNSHLINIDGRFEAPIGGVDLFSIKAFRSINNKGYNLRDVRASLKWKELKLSFIAANIDNLAYTVRPGLLEAPKNYTIRLDYKF